MAATNLERAGPYRRRRGSKQPTTPPWPKRRRALSPPRSARRSTRAELWIPVEESTEVSRLKSVACHVRGPGRPGGIRCPPCTLVVGLEVYRDGAQHEEPRCRSATHVREPHVRKSARSRASRGKPVAARLPPRSATTCAARRATTRAARRRTFARPSPRWRKSDRRARRRISSSHATRSHSLC